MVRFLTAAAVLLAAGTALASEGPEEAGGNALLRVDPGLLLWTLVTFAIVLFVLRKVAWKPLLEAVDQREKNIQSAIDGARTDREEAERLLAEHRRMLDDARRQTAEIVAQGQKDAERIVEDAKGAARGEAEKIVEQSRRQIEQETRSAMAEVRGTVADLALAAAGKLIGRSLDDAGHRGMVDEFVRDLESRDSTGDGDKPS
jgi:F-type H+-transporting ATPase subunit b